MCTLYNPHLSAGDKVQWKSVLAQVGNVLTVSFGSWQHKYPIRNQTFLFFCCLDTSLLPLLIRVYEVQHTNVFVNSKPVLFLSKCALCLGSTWLNYLIRYGDKEIESQKNSRTIVSFYSDSREVFDLLLRKSMIWWKPTPVQFKCNVYIEPKRRIKFLNVLTIAL